MYLQEEARVVLGCICNDLNLLRNRNYKISERDFDSLFHKIIFGAVSNLALEKDVNLVDGFMVDTYLSKFSIQHEVFNQNNGVDFINVLKDKTKNSSFEYSYKTLRKCTLLRRFKSVGMDIGYFSAEDNKEAQFNVTNHQEIVERFNKATIDEMRIYFKNKLIEADEDFNNSKDGYYFKASDGIMDLLDRCKNQKQWGVGFQCRYFNTFYKGMQGGKYIIRSGSTGSGKSRLSIGDMCNIACKKRFIPKKGIWITRRETYETLFISTELTQDEVQLAMLCTIAGVEEERIKEGRTSQEEDKRLLEAVKILDEAKIHCEYTSDFSVTEIEGIIETHLIRNNVKFVFFDYIQLTSNLAQELNKLFGYVLREDQMLNQLSTSLKTIVNKYNIFLITSTQLNRNYKVDKYLDATHLRGGKRKA